MTESEVIVRGGPGQPSRPRLAGSSKRASRAALDRVPLPRLEGGKSPHRWRFFSQPETPEAEPSLGAADLRWNLSWRSS